MIQLLKNVSMSVDKIQPITQQPKDVYAYPDTELTQQEHANNAVQTSSFKITIALPAQ